MKNLFLIRHAHAEKFSESNHDIDRKLTSEGMKVASLLGKYLSDEGVVPDVVICSPAERARMTAELVATQLGQSLNDIQVVDGLYEASVREFVEYLTGLSQKYQTVLVIGHNPAITYTADYLCETEINGMIPGSVVHISFAKKLWNELSNKASGEFINYYDVLTDH
jgi:phosphohistidine phosphatase